MVTVNGIAAQLSFGIKSEESTGPIRKDCKMTQQELADLIKEQGIEYVQNLQEYAYGEIMQALDLAMEQGYR